MATNEVKIQLPFDDEGRGDLQGPVSYKNVQSPPPYHKEAESLLNNAGVLR